MDAEADLWADYLAGRSDEARNRLVERFLPYAYGTAERLYRKLARSSDWDLGDLNSWAVEGLIQAVASFDPARKIKFTSFATQRIRGAIFDGLRNIDPAPRLMRKRAQEGLETVPGKTSWETIRANQAWVGSDYTEPADLHESEISCKANDLAFWQEALQGRSNVERIILLLYYREELTMKQIGESLGLSESRVSQIHSQLIVLLRERLSKRLPHLVPRPKPEPEIIQEPEAMPTTQAALPVEEGQRPGLKFLLTETTPGTIEQQIALHEAAILDHHREIQAWKALLECLRTLEQNPSVMVSPAGPPEPAQRCTLATLTGVFTRAGRDLTPAEIAAELQCSNASASQGLARYPDNFERVERGLYRLKAA